MKPDLERVKYGLRVPMFGKKHIFARSSAKRDKVKCKA